jgi:putative protein-disulfide isomerase
MPRPSASRAGMNHYLKKILPYDKKKPVIEQKAVDSHNNTRQQAGGVDITYYTDPLCCWSWAFEPHWQQLLEAFAGKISYRYCMGGLLPGWDRYHDSINSVSRPVQMGPVWMHARELSGVPIYDRIWFEDPPASSYPACMAVKCATLQSLVAGEIYLQKAREAVMTKGINIAKQPALLHIAEQMAKDNPQLLDTAVFSADMSSGRGMEALRADLQEVQYRGIDRFPSFIIRSAQQPSIIVRGYRPFDVIQGIIRDRV